MTKRATAEKASRSPLRHGRPVEERSAGGIRREIDSLTRLRTALKIDRRIPRERSRELDQQIERLIDELVVLLHEWGGEAA